MLGMMIPSLNRMRVLVECLDNIEIYNYMMPADYCMFVCLQGFHTGEAKWLVKHFPKGKFYMFSKPLGPGGARAFLGKEILQAKGVDPILSFDDDTIFTDKTNVLNAMTLIENPADGIGIVQFSHDTKIVKPGLDIKQPILTTGGGNLFSRELLERIGGYRKDEYLDDMELSARAYITGYTNIRTTRACARTRQNRIDGFQLYYKHYPAKTYFFTEYGQYLKKRKNPDKIRGTNRARIPGDIFTSFNVSGREMHEMNRKTLLEDLKVIP